MIQGTQGGGPDGGGFALAADWLVRHFGDDPDAVRVGLRLDNWLNFERDSLLLRFYDIQRGSIRIGGVDVRDLDPLELRRNFGVVLQDPYLFTGTVEEKIDALIADKKRLSSAIVGSDESWLTELDNETFKNLIALQRSAIVD